MHIKSPALFIPFDEQLAGFIEPQVGTLLSDEEAMRLAIQVALKGAGHVSPNPLVGSIACDKQGRYLGWGAHLKYGEAHAEAHLVQKLRTQNLLFQLKGGVVYVTFEPCSHHGKTPPCAELLTTLEIKRVVFGKLDPFPQVNGRGKRLLEEHGITCEELFLPDIENLSLPFCERMHTGKPFFALKAAMTLDGSYAREGDERPSITSQRALEYAHWLRLFYDSVVVGAKTVICDNPTLNIRHPKISRRTPLRIVLDPNGAALQSRPLNELNLIQSEGERTLWILSSTAAKHLQPQMATLSALGVNVEILEKKTEGFCLDTFCELLNKYQIHSVLLEGGGGVWGYFWQQRLVHYAHLIMAPCIWGGKNRRGWAMNFQDSWAQNLTDMKLATLPPDFVVEGRIIARIT